MPDDDFEGVGAIIWSVIALISFVISVVVWYFI